MAERGDLRSGGEGDGVDRMKISGGYRLGKNQTVHDVLAVEAELLRSEGIDPAWPGFDEAEIAKAQSPS
jgi:hypothetical protein